MTAELGAAAIGAGLLLALLAATSKALVADGLGLDRGLAATFCGAKQGETISLIAAQRDRLGIWRWCLLCRFLGVFVERDHCAKQLDPNSGSTPLLSSLRAGVLLLILAGLLYALPWAFWRVCKALWWVVATAWATA